MAVAERHHPPCHYLFNTDVIGEDLSVFEIEPASVASNTSDNSNGRGTVYFRSLNTSSGNTNVVIKEYQRGGAVRHFNKNLYWHRHYSQSRVWREFKLLLKMKSADLPVPVPVAGRAKRKFPQWYESTIVTAEIENAKTLAERLKKTSPNLVDCKLWQRIGETIKRFHEVSIYHADLNANNILLAENDDVYLIDFDKSRLMFDGYSAWKKGNLDRLRHSLQKHLRTEDQFQFSSDNWRTLLSGYER